MTKAGHTFTAVKVHESRSHTEWQFEKYIVTTYPGSALVFMVSAATGKRVKGAKIEERARAAIAKATAGGAV